MVGKGLDKPNRCQFVKPGARRPQAGARLVLLLSGKSVCVCMCVCVCVDVCVSAPEAMNN